MIQPQPETRIASNVAEKAKAGLIKHLESSVATSAQTTREDLSATPRTDDFKNKQWAKQCECPTIDFARILERENNRLRKELELVKCANKHANAAIGDIANECKVYVAKLAEVEKDKARLDWLEKNPSKPLHYYKKTWVAIGFTNYEYGTYSCVREAIDAAMKQT